jgi:hypothetical protein
LAHGATRIAALHRLKNPRLIDEPEFQRLKTEEDNGAGQTIADFPFAPETSPNQSAQDDFRRRFLELVFYEFVRTPLRYPHHWKSGRNLLLESNPKTDIFLTPYRRHISAI